MEQRDYLLREIEKIGAIMRAILGKIAKSTNDTLSIEKELDATKNMLSNDLSFEIDTFLTMDNKKPIAYIQNIEGFNVENIESMARWLSEIGFHKSDASSIDYLEKALILFELCNTESNTFSFDREYNISQIRNRLQS